jgi:hypothetical protein
MIERLNDERSVFRLSFKLMLAWPNGYVVIANDLRPILFSINA